MTHKKDKQEILNQIRELKTQCGSIIDAIVETCSINNIEIETISQYIKSSKDLKKEVEAEGVKLKMLNM